MWFTSNKLSTGAVCSVLCPWAATQLFFLAEGFGEAVGFLHGEQITWDDSLSSG